MNIKKLLFSYALARPSVRFALKVLKGKNDNVNWTYAPSTGNSSLASAAPKVVGKEVASQCELQTFSTVQDEADAGGGRYHLEALLVSAQKGQ